MPRLTSPPTRLYRGLAGFLAGPALLLWLTCAAAQAATLPADMRDLALSFFPDAEHMGEIDGTPPAAPLFRGRELLGYVFLSDEVVRIPAYSGKPISVLVGFDVAGVIRGVRIVAHQEPILLVGVTEENLTTYVDQYLGRNVFDRFKIGGEERPGFITVDGISGATITVMVLNASITRAARTVAESRGVPLATGATAGGEAALRKAQPVEATVDEPIWEGVWESRRARIWVLAAGLLVLTLILVLQDWFAWHATLLSYLRLAFLTYTLVFIGWYALAQLSVINVLTFISAFMGDFRWETFLIEPLTFILWGFVAVTLLLWGRGVYCGWLCPFGALQELTNKAAVHLGLRQFLVPALIHERLLAIKYIILLGLFALFLQSAARRRALRRGRAIQDGDHPAFSTGMALRRLCPRTDHRVPVQRQILLQVPVPPGRSAHHPQPLPHFRLAAPPQGMRQALPDLCRRVPLPGDSPQRRDQRQRVPLLPGLPGDLLGCLQVPAHGGAPQTLRAARATIPAEALTRDGAS